MNTTTCQGNLRMRRRTDRCPEWAAVPDGSSRSASSFCSIVMSGIVIRSLLLLGVVPLRETLLEPRCGGLRGHLAVHDVRAREPELVLQVRVAPGEDLVAEADRRLAGVA